MHRSNVDLPHPEGPRTVTICAGGTSNESPFNTASLPFFELKVWLSRSMTIRDIGYPIEKVKATSGTSNAWHGFSARKRRNLTSPRVHFLWQVCQCRHPASEEKRHKPLDTLLIIRDSVILTIDCKLLGGQMAPPDRVAKLDHGRDWLLLAKSLQSLAELEEGRSFRFNHDTCEQLATCLLLVFKVKEKLFDQVAFIKDMEARHEIWCQSPRTSDSLCMYSSNVIANT